MLRRFLCLCLIFVLASLPVKGRARENKLACLVQEELFTLLTNTNGFLTYLETGAPATAPAELDAQLQKISDNSFPQKLRAAGLDSAVNQTLSLLSRQRKLLAEFHNSGKGAANRLARRLNARNQLTAFQKQIAPLPCDNTERNSRKGVAPLSQSEPFPIGEISVIATLLLLSLAGAIFLLEKRERLKKRRWKRHACVLDCVVRCSEGFLLSQLVDISQVGAKVRLDCSCEPGEQIEIGLAGQQFSAKVIWHNSNYAGITFRRRISSSQLNKVLELKPAGPKSAIA